MNFRVIKGEDKNEWDNILQKVETYDFYHTASYHRLDTSGEARLLAFEDGNDCVALPLIFRKIPTTKWQDVTSVYGYAGLIRKANVDFPEIFASIENYFNEQKVISAFSRIHPLIEGADLFHKGDVVNISSTRGIDLTLTPDAQFHLYSESVRRFIRKVKKMGMTVRLAKSVSDIALFTKIYNDSMKRINASSHYFFSFNYINNLLNSPEFESFILLSEIDGNVTGGCFFTICNQIMEYHLGAVVEKYKYYSPLKLLIHEAAIIGNNKGLSVLHLGGGYGGTNDNLFVFKSRMSNLNYSFKVWKWIVNEIQYNELSEHKIKSSFFPLYRS